MRELDSFKSFAFASVKKILRSNTSSRNVPLNDRSNAA